MQPQVRRGVNMLLSMLLAGQAQEVVVRAVELRPANPWVEVFSASCGRQRLEVRKPMHPRRPVHGCCSMGGQREANWLPWSWT